LEGFFVDSIYEDIARRTDGDIYIGVVGPVRTGKSTFIKRFMETLVIPNIENVQWKERARDELPQSGSGRTIMTAEPKFVPEEAVDIALSGDATASVRLIDCVGYMVPGAEGLYEDGAERMVTTPWYDREIPMTQAAEEGTRKVIAEHSTIGLVVTTDGSIGDIPRESYLAAEQRVVQQLQDIGKPFALVLNCAQPQADSAQTLAQELSAQYGVPCMALNCQEMTEGDIHQVMETVLFQFPLVELSLWLPAWAEALPEDSGLKQSLYAMFLSAGQEMGCLRDAYTGMESIAQSEYVAQARITAAQAGLGTASAVVELERSLYYQTISEQSGFEIKDDGDLMELLRSLKTVKSEYDHVHEALAQARETGYGVIMPEPEEMVLEEPQIISRGGRYSVRLKASAPAIHLFQTQVETEVSPAVGGERASEEIVSFLLQGFDGDMSQIWQSNIFGKSLNDIAQEGLTTKLTRMPPNVRNRLRITMQRLINDGGYSLICIIL
jgi:stage IV sporulation protein A